MSYAFQLDVANLSEQVVASRRRFVVTKLSERNLTVLKLQPHRQELVAVLASEDVLRSELEALLQADTATAFHTSAGYELGAEAPARALTPAEKEQLIRSAIDRIQLEPADLPTLRWMGTMVSESKVGSPLFRTLLEGTDFFVSAFPLHEELARTHLGSKIMRTWTLPVHDIRSYFGSQMALSFALLGHLQRWLCLPALFGLVVSLLSSTSWSAFAAISYGLFVPLWAVLCLKYWRRTDAKLVFAWDFAGLKTERSLIKWQLRGPGRLAEATSRAPYFRLSPNLLWNLTTHLPVVLLMLLASVGLMLACLNAEGKVPPSSPFFFQSIGVASGRFCGLRLFLPVIHPALIYLISRTYSMVVCHLTMRDGWATKREFNSVIALKRVPFEFFNFFLSAIVRSLWMPDVGAVRSELMGVLIGDIALRLLSDSVIPMAGPFIRFMRQRSDDKDVYSRLASGTASADKVLREASLDTVTQFDIYITHIKYFALVSCFAGVVPTAACLVWFASVLEPKLLLLSMLYFRQRLPSERAVNIGSWLDIMNITANASVTTNCVLLAHTSGLLAQVLSTETILGFHGHFGIAFALEQVERSAVWILKQAIPDIPQPLREKLDSQALKQRAMRQWTTPCQASPAEGSSDGPVPRPPCSPRSSIG